MTLAGVDVVCLGEVLVDFLPIGGRAYMTAAGGAPANVAAALAHRRQSVAMIGRCGADWMGALVVDTLAAHGVVVDRIQQDPVRPTGMSVVARPPHQEPPFVMYRAADDAVELDQADRRLIAGARLLHVSSLLPGSETGTAALAEAAAAARAAGTTISADVNLRPSAWPDEEAMLAAARAVVDSADVVKVTVEELDALGLAPADLAATDKLWLVTDGGRGARAVHGDLVRAATAPQVPVVDTTGAGDASFAGLLDLLLDSRVIGGDEGFDRGRIDGGLLDLAVHAAVGAGAAAVQVEGGMPPLTQDVVL